MKHLVQFDESAPIIELRDVVVEYSSPQQRGRFRAVDGVSMSFPPGQTVSVVGESGSGKSTLGRVSLGLIRPTKGLALFRGVPLQFLTFAQQRRYRREVQVVFQDPGTSLNPRMRVRAIVGAGLRIHRLVAKGDLEDAVVGLLERVGLSPGRRYLDRLPAQLSGGERQRVAIARAIALRPKLIVADEALSALDMSVQSQVLDLLAGLQTELGMAYMFISHDLDTVHAISDQVVVMQRGTIVEQGDPDGLFAAPQHPYTQKLLDARLPAEPATLIRRAPGSAL